MLFQSDTETFGVLNSFSLVSMIFLQRDYPVMVRSTPSRILYFITCISAFIVFAFYTAVLTSYMTAQEAPPQIKVNAMMNFFRWLFPFLFIRALKMLWKESIKSTFGTQP